MGLVVIRALCKFIQSFSTNFTLGSHGSQAIMNNLLSKNLLTFMILLINCAIINDEEYSFDDLTSYLKANHVPGD